MDLTKKGLFFISDYRDVTCEFERDPSFHILKELDKNDKLKVYSTANKVVDSSCFKNIDFLPLNYKGNIQIQKPMYNYRIYKTYKKVEDKVEIIHHWEKFQIGKGYNLIPFLSDLEDKTFIIGPTELPHKVFEEDFLGDTKGFKRAFEKFVYLNRNNLGMIFKYLFKKTVERADKVIVPDKATKKELSKYISNSKIEIISHYGVDLSIYREYKYSADENNYNIVYAGSAIKRKGVEYLLEAIPLIKKQFLGVKLHLRTEGYKIDEYKKIIKELGISDNVVFYGRFEINKYLELVSKSRLVCLPTLSEGYGWIIQDAVCLGIPVVTTTECIGDEELFENGAVGLRVGPRDSSALADAILKLFNDFELCKRFGENGLKKREKFDYGKIIPKYVKLYDEYI